MFWQVVHDAGPYGAIACVRLPCQGTAQLCGSARHILTHWLDASAQRTTNAAELRDVCGGAPERPAAALGLRTEQPVSEQPRGCERAAPRRRAQVMPQMEAPMELLMPLLPYQKEFLAWAIKQERSDVRGGCAGAAPAGAACTGVLQ